MLKKTSILLLFYVLEIHGQQNDFSHRSLESGVTTNNNHINFPNNFSEGDETNTSQPVSTDGETTVEDSEVSASEPVAEKFIGSWRKKPHPEDVMREKMIGMIFTGEPQPLGVRPRVRDNVRRRFRTRPNIRQKIQHIPFHIHESPKEILRPMAFIPHQSNVEFPMPVLQSSASRRHPSQFIRGPPPKAHLNVRPERRPTTRRERRPGPFPGPFPSKPFPSFHENDHFASSKDIFSNTVGPDFGPVTFEEFGANFETDFNNFEIPRLPPKTSKPHSPQPKPPRISKPHFNPSSDETPFGFTSTTFGGQFEETPKFEGFPTDLGPDGCHKYTEDICLDTDNYPHEEILTSLARNPKQARTLMAEVRDQSADDLVDGVTAAQEAKYDFRHYYGNRRSDSSQKQTARDFAEDGGYLCPSEVKYARPKRARNSKKEWKFIVNMDKYSQTIRMEKCMKPGGSCSYVSHHYRATCSQIYNYQRLLSWEKKKGLHMDIFKVPSCCTCHIQGYAYVFPPLSRQDIALAGSARIDHFVTSEKNPDGIHRKAPPYSPINFPNLPNSPRNNPKRKTERRNDSEERAPPRGRNRSRPAKTVNRSDSTFPRVNYDYHPIIDFFEESSKVK